MKIISWNVNGLRAIEKKGELHNFITMYSPEILCLQETKSKHEQVKFIDEKFPEYEKFYHSAEKPGYSGTAIWIQRKFSASHSFHSGMPDFNDTEGRISRVDFTKDEKNFSVIGVYFPNGGKSPEAWDGPDGKLDFYIKFLSYVQELKSQGRTVIFCGDVNTCHQEVDIARPKSNEGKIGFHPLERQKISNWITAGWKDIWREKNPEVIDQYSWWSYRGGARDRNVGWRIDYFFIDEKFLPSVQKIQYLNAQIGSDHCPVSLEVF